MTLECEDWEIYQLKCWRNHNHVYMKDRILICIYCTLFFFRPSFVQLGFTGKILNKVVTIFLWSSKGECYKIWELCNIMGTYRWSSIIMYIFLWIPIKWWTPNENQFNFFMNYILSFLFSSSFSTFSTVYIYIFELGLKKF